MLEQVSVTNYRSFTDLSVPLRLPAEPQSGWTVLVGENGVGKSSLLQAIVLALLDSRPATNLVPSPWEMCRRGLGEPSSARMSVTFVDDEGQRRLVGKTVAPESGSYLEDDGSPLTHVPLVLAFSARRRLARPSELPESTNRKLERVRSLFSGDYPLLAVDAFETLADNGQRRAYSKVVRDVVTHELRHTRERLFPLIDSMELRGNGGLVKQQQLLGQQRFALRYADDYRIMVGIHELSDGYQAMLGLVLEILNQAVLHFGEVPDPGRLNAVVLVDELEAHLHPKWQRSVIPLLREIFPRCQFIVTTHSPLLVASAEPGEVYVLSTDPERGDVRGELLETRLTAADADQIYETVFGVPRSAPPTFVHREREYLSQLARGDDRVDPTLAALVEEAWRSARQ